ncbi:MAG: hypothetical protein HY077_12240 [Elusimicrobia bacterium]|nr:hypothetical protein [Elusimicrobiota bacterium]
MAVQEKSGVNISAQFSTFDVLKTAQANNLPVNLNLRGGAQYSAKVKDLGQGAVVLQGPAGKDFYDVYVPLAEISSIELKVRDR